MPQLLRFCRRNRWFATHRFPDSRFAAYPLIGSLEGSAQYRTRKPQLQPWLLRRRCGTAPRKFPPHTLGLGWTGGTIPALAPARKRTRSTTAASMIVGPSLEAALSIFPPVGPAPWV